MQTVVVEGIPDPDLARKYSRPFLKGKVAPFVRRVVDNISTNEMRIR